LQPGGAGSDRPNDGHRPGEHRRLLAAIHPAPERRRRMERVGHPRTIARGTDALRGSSAHRAECCALYG
jgi:hypothetical protein